MKIWFAIGFIFLLLPGNLLASEKRGQGEKQLFLAYNIWETSSASNMKCINYKSGRLIPAGTEVIKSSVYDEVDDSEMFAQSEDTIVFKIKETGKNIVIGFEERWHPGKTIYDYYDMMFTTKTFSELVSSLNGLEVKSIKTGNLVPGMSKEAVLIAYGYPPEHVTPDFAASDVWVYWRNKFGKKQICFDSQSLTVKCSEMNTL